WPDRTGARRALWGPHAIAVPKDEEISAFFAPEALLDAEVCGRAHVRALSPQVLSADSLVEALSPEAKEPFRLEPSPEVLRRALPLLCARGCEIGSKGRERLAALPLFLSDRGVLCRVERLSLAASPALRALYGEYEGRQFVDPEGESLALLTRLGLEARL